MTPPNIKIKLPQLDEMVSRGKKIVDQLNKRGTSAMDALTAKGAAYWEEAVKSGRSVLQVDEMMKHEKVKWAVEEMAKVKDRAVQELQESWKLATDTVAPALEELWDRMPEQVRKAWAQVPATMRTAWNHLPDSVRELAEKLPLPVPLKGEPEAGEEKVELDPPLEGYDELNVRKVADLLETLDPEQLKRVREYEAATKNRVTVLRAVDKLLAKEE